MFDYIWRDILLDLKKNVDLDKFFSETLIKFGKNLRKAQLELSKDIEETYTGNKIFIAEAEVGTGKTYAYLIPSINKIHQSKKPFLISTGTIVLQEQLLQKDIPDLNIYLKKEGIISSDIISYIGKGKEHYICERRLMSCDIDEEELDNIKKQYEKKNRYDRTEIDLKNNEELWKKINVKHCDRKSCQYRECLYRQMKMKQEYFNYDYLVCNHQYFLACIKNENQGFLNKFSGIVIDEAHNFEQAAFSIFGDNKSVIDFIKCIEQVSNQLSKTYGYMVDDIKIRNAYKLSNKLFERIKKRTCIPVGVAETIGQYDVTIDSEIQHLSEELYDCFEYLSDKLSIFSSFGSRIRRSEDGLYNQVKSLQNFLENISFTSTNNVWWTQLDSNKHNGNKYRLFYIPKNIDEILHETLFSKGLPIILTSGTMSSEEVIKGSESLAFQYFSNNIGVDQVAYSKQKTPTSKKSGFNYFEHGLLYIEKDIKFVSQDNENNYNGYLDKLCERIYNIIELSNGRTLVLFTSKYAMDYTYAKVANKIKTNLNINCFKQGQSQKIKHEFEIQVNSCLFATGTYWEGIDVKGESLSTLIIQKLPFPIPSPIFKFKEERYNDDILIPEMVVKLKQGAGRLIRDENDRGVLAILDSRANHKNYNKIIMENIPPFRKIENLNQISEFLNINQSNDTTLYNNKVQAI